MVCKVQNCCGCVDLKCGCFILGYLRLILNIVLPVVILVIAHEKPESRYTQLELESIHIYTYVVLAECILNTVFNIVFIVGLHKNYRGYVMAYIIYSGVSIAFSCVVFIISLNKETNPQEVLQFIMPLVSSFYFLAVIRSYYIKMNEPEVDPAVICNLDTVEAQDF